MLRCIPFQLDSDMRAKCNVVSVYGFWNVDRPNKPENIPFIHIYTCLSNLSYMGIPIPPHICRKMEPLVWGIYTYILVLVTNKIISFFFSIEIIIQLT